MKGTSYLLYLDGSAQSMNAAKFAWSLAGTNNASVAALHVVDSVSVWKNLAFDEPGFVGSGVYLEAREQILGVMHSIANAIALAYTSLADGLELNSQMLIDEGDVISEITKRSIDHDLIIMGYRGNSSQERNFIEQLAKKCACPILLVARKIDKLSTLKVFFASGNLLVLDAAKVSIFAESLKLPLELYLQTAKRRQNENSKISASIPSCKHIVQCELEEFLEQDASSLILLSLFPLRQEVFNCSEEGELAQDSLSPAKLYSARDRSLDCTPRLAS